MQKTVPGVAIVVAFVLVVLSIIVLVVYVDHIGKSLRVSSLIELVGKATRQTLDERYPDRGSEPPADRPDEHVIRASHSGVVSHVDEDELIDEARAADVVIELHVGLGAFVPAGSALLTAPGGSEPVDDSSRRLEDVLRDLRSVAPPERQAVLDKELELLHAAVHDRYREPSDVLLALEPDRQGLGIGAPRFAAARLTPDD